MRLGIDFLVSAERLPLPSPLIPRCLCRRLGAIEFWNRRFTGGKPDHERDLALDHGYPRVYYTFVTNMIRLELKNAIVPLPLPSSIAADYLAELKVQIDLIHIDGSHEYDDVCGDIFKWFPLLSPGGILMGDDYSWPGVIAAVDEFSQKTGMSLHTKGVKWWFQAAKLSANLTATS